jgi:hypothetical protein
MVERIACLLVFGLGALAQSEEPKIAVNLDGFRYPPIARQARIQGNVVLRVRAGRREIFSSANPLLTPVAEDNLKTWMLPPLATGNYLVTYHFSILPAGTKPETVPIGNSFDRFFLRLVHAKTVKVVQRCYNETGTEDAARSTTHEAGGDLLIDVFATTKLGCQATTEGSALALNSPSHL